MAAIRRAIVLAAGEGTRLRPLTLSRPKALVPVGGVPVLDHILAHLSHHGVREAAINLFYLPEAITSFVGDGRRWGLDVRYLHEPRLLGSGGTLRALANLLDEPFYLVYGDVVTDADLAALAEEHEARRAALTCLLHHVPDPENKGIAALAPDGRIRRFVEKPPRGQEPGDLAAAGVYVVGPAVVSVVPERTPCDFGGDVVPAALAAGLPVYGSVQPAAYILDIGSPAALAAGDADAAAGRVRLLRASSG